MEASGLLGTWVWAEVRASGMSELKLRTGRPLISGPAFLPISVVAVMTTLQATKNPVLRGVSPTPSKIPVRSQRRPPLPTVKPCALDQENQDPKVRGDWWVKTVAASRQPIPPMHPKAEPQFLCSPPPEIGAEAQPRLSRPRSKSHTSNREIREISGEHSAPEPLGGTEA